MRPLTWTVLSLLALAPLVDAGGVHDGPEAVTVSMFIHHTEAGLLLNPAAPTSHAATTPAHDIACGEPATWSARFAQDPSTPGADQLARPAAFDATPPRLTWFMETVQPGTDEPMPAAPTPWTLTAELLGNEARPAYAAGSTAQTSTVEVEGRHVVKAEVAMPWLDPGDTTIPIGGLTLRITATIDEPTGCDIAPIGLRPYTDTQRVDRIVWDLYEPVRLEHFETGWMGETLMIQVHTSSPWGPPDLAAPQAPVLTTPDGSHAQVTLADLVSPGNVQATWAWDAAGARNGTYRVDVSTERADGTSAVDAWSTFRVGGDAPTPTPATATPKDTPGLATPIALLALALARRVS